MYRLLALYPHPTDPEHFKANYVNKHVPLAPTMPGLKASRYRFSPEGVTGPSSYFCVFEGDSADKAAFEAAVASPEGPAPREAVLLLRGDPAAEGGAPG